MAIQFRRGTKSAITSANPVLLAGQPCIETDTGQMKVGNGSSNYNSLKYVGATYTTFKGATSSAAGGTGLVPAPAAGAQAKFLRADGTWQTPANTTYSNMTGATTSTAGKAGLVPAPAAGAATRFLRSDGTWQVPPDTNTDTKVTNTLNNSAKAYVTGTTSASTNTGTQVFDNGVFLETSAGGLRVTSLNIGDHARLAYDSANKAIKITFM